MPVPKRTLSVVIDSGRKKKRARTSASKQAANFYSRIYNGPAPSRAGFPKTRKATLTYADSVSLSASAIGVFHQFNANGCYDPDSSGAGHQPHGFDQWMAFYNHYTVESVSVKLTVLKDDTTSGSPGIIGISLAPDTTTTDLSTLSKYLEYPYRSNTKISGIVSQMALPQASTLYWKPDLKMFLNAGKSMVNESQFRGNVSSNPSEGAILNISKYPLNGNTAIDCQCLVEINYDVVFTEPKVLA